MRKGSVSKFEKQAVNNRHADCKYARGLQESALWSSLQAGSTSPLFFRKHRQCMRTVWTALSRGPNPKLGGGNLSQCDQKPNTHTFALVRCCFPIVQSGSLNNTWSRCAVPLLNLAFEDGRQDYFSGEIRVINKGLRLWDTLLS